MTERVSFAMKTHNRDKTPHEIIPVGSDPIQMNVEPAQFDQLTDVRLVRNRYTSQ